MSWNNTDIWFLMYSSKVCSSTMSITSFPTFENAPQHVQEGPEQKKRNNDFKRCDDLTERVTYIFTQDYANRIPYQVNVSQLLSYRYELLSSNSTSPGNSSFKESHILSTLVVTSQVEFFRETKKV